MLDADHEARTVQVKWPTDRAESDHPSVLVEYDWVNEGAKAGALASIADELLRGGRAPSASLALLENRAPVFRRSVELTVPPFSPDLREIRIWSTKLDRSVVPVQGPPGTGKTFTASHVVRHLARRGLRVGITAMSHAAITNLVEEVVERYREADDLASLRLVQKTKDGTTHLDEITSTASNSVAASVDFDIVAGTTWTFASDKLRCNPVDVLIVDEGGQLALADLAAASASSESLIVIGDPQQLPQVAQAVHPNDSGSSALTHVIGAQPTIDETRGVLLDTTRRMHPAINRYISDVMYESRLLCHETCAVQTTDDGVGLRWLGADHVERSTSSPEEAELIAEEIERLIGVPWTDAGGLTRPLRADDFIVVAPYNHQRRTIARRLQASSTAASVPVGTVDKFQGREAAVVFFSMTSSSEADMPRGLGFLFSTNRFNVAVSRARCLAYVVSTEQLLHARARTVEEQLCHTPLRC